MPKQKRQKSINTKQSFFTLCIFYTNLLSSGVPIKPVTQRQTSKTRIDQSISFAYKLRRF